MEGQSSRGSRRPGTRAGLGSLPMPQGVAQTGAPSKFPRESCERKLEGEGVVPGLHPHMPLPSGSLWSHGTWALPCPQTMSHPSSTWAVVTTATAQT
uniref:Inositol polyphosphate-5-phosphatase J n=1 Tax=Homo sapiens TaxID=9606 RepID=C9J0H5_HUMAN